MKSANKGGKNNSDRNSHKRLEAESPENDGRRRFLKRAALLGSLALMKIGCSNYAIKSISRDATADRDVDDPRDAEPDVPVRDARPDVNNPRDAEPDVATPEASVPDAQVDSAVADAEVDSSVPDSSVPDSSIPDAEVDSAVPDSSVPDAEVDAGLVCENVGQTQPHQTVLINVNTVQSVEGIDVRYVELDPNHVLSPTWAYVDVECTQNGYVFTTNVLLVEAIETNVDLTDIGKRVTLRNNWAAPDQLNVTVTVGPL